VTFPAVSNNVSYLLAAAADLPGGTQQRFLLVGWVGWLPPLTFQVVRKNVSYWLAGWAGGRR
jgi:hypothetical protein